MAQNRHYKQFIYCLCQVGSEVARVACEADGGGGATRHMQNMDWEYAVVASNDVNAFVVPGGKVVVFRGACGDRKISMTRLQPYLTN